MERWNNQNKSAEWVGRNDEFPNDECRMKTIRHDGLTFVIRHSSFRHSRSRRGSRDGKITLVTLFAILGLVVMAGFVGNIGQAVSTKIDAQNAADAVAFSSAQWMARGMNSLTATNHLLGEVTGLCVVIEALGGPEMDAGMAVYTK